MLLRVELAKRRVIIGTRSGDFRPNERVLIITARCEHKWAADFGLSTDCAVIERMLDHHERLCRPAETDAFFSIPVARRG